MMRTFIKTFNQVALLVLAVLAIIFKDISLFVYILLGLLATDVIMQLTADESKGEEKLNAGGIFSYLIFGAIGIFIFKPWWRGFIIVNALADSILTLIPLMLSCRLKKG